MLNLFLDSGAHSIYQQIIKQSGGRDYDYVETKEFWDYVDKYAEYVKTHKDILQVYVNVDVIFNPEATWRVQRYLEEQHKLKPLPVFHFFGKKDERGFDDIKTRIKWFKRYMDDHEYIGISGLGQENVKALYREKFGNVIFDLISSGPSRIPRWRIHGFGLTSVDLLFEYPFYSVDSSSWVYFARYGAILVPKTDRGEPVYNTSPHTIFLSKRSPKLKDGSSNHYETLPEGTKEYIRNYVQSKGYSLGESKVYKEKGKLKEKVLEPGLCNDCNIRDELNLLFYLDAVKRVPNWPWPFSKQCLSLDDLGGKGTEEDPIIVSDNHLQFYAAGNFPRMKNPELEKALMNVVLKDHPMYNRLVTFFFPKDADTLINIKRGIKPKQSSPLTTTKKGAVMKVNREELEKILAGVKPGLAKKEIIEEQGHFLFTGKEIATYNEEFCIAHSFSTDFSCSVKASHLYKIINRLRAEEIELEFDEENGKLIIKTERSENELQTVTESETMKKTVSVQNELKKGIKKEDDFWNDLPENFLTGASLCSFAASKDLLSERSCVYVFQKNLLCSDGRRISWFTMDKEMKGGFLIRATATKDLDNIKANQYGETESWLHFMGEGICFSMRKIKGQYDEKYMALFDEDFSVARIRLPEDVSYVVESSSVLAEDSDLMDRNVIITLEENELKCSWKGDKGKQKHSTEIKFNKDPVSFAINPSFFLQALAAGVTTMSIGDRQVLLRGENFRHIVVCYIKD